MIRTRAGVGVVVAVAALQAEACTFGPGEEIANTDAGVPSSGGSATGGASAIGGAQTGGRATGGRRNTGGDGANGTGGSKTGGAPNGGSGGGGGSSSGGTAATGGSVATGGASTGGVSNGGEGGAETGGTSSGGASSGGAGGSTGGAATGGALTTDASSGGGGPIDASVPDADASTDGGGSCGPCPVGQYCDLQSFVCRPGCGSGAMCASGSCTATHDCDRCVSDSECAEGRVCSTGRCLPPCVNTLGCPTGYTCCGNRCADTARDHEHCASCNAACTGGDYCAAVGCRQTSVATVCDTPHVTFILSGASHDDALVPVLAAALTSGCPSPPAVSTEPETASLAINPTTAQPVAGAGDIIVELGGPYTSNVAKYVESHGLTRIYDTTPDGVVVGFYSHSADGGSDPQVAVALFAAYTATHDFFKIEMVVDPVSGTRIFQVYGIFAPGTSAAAWFFQHRMLTNLSAYPLRYYVYEWTHGDAGTNPGANDTFTLVASGN